MILEAHLHTYSLTSAETSKFRGMLQWAGRCSHGDDIPMPDLDALNIHVPIRWLHDETIKKMATTPSRGAVFISGGQCPHGDKDQALSTPGEQASTPQEDDADFRTKTLKGAIDSGQYGLGGNLNKVLEACSQPRSKAQGRLCCSREEAHSTARVQTKVGQHYV